MSREQKINVVQTRFKRDTDDSLKCNDNIDYFLAGPNRQAGMERSEN